VTVDRVPRRELAEIIGGLMTLQKREQLALRRLYLLGRGLIIACDKSPLPAALVCRREC